jgi:hypothetical protein
MATLPSLRAERSNPVTPLFLLMLLLMGGIAAGNRVTAQDNPAGRYLSAAENRAFIYTGKTSLPYSVHIAGHPYLRFTKGVLWYDGVAYSQTYVRVDSYRDDLVVLTPDGSAEIILQPHRVDSVCFDGCHVFYFRPDGRMGCPSGGYYYRLYEGESTVLERRTYSLYETRKGEEVTAWFGLSTKYYIRKDEAYYPVRSKGSVLKALGAYKKELNSYAREQKLNFRRNTGEAIVSIVKEYERLNRKP